MILNEDENQCKNASKNETNIYVIAPLLKCVKSNYNFNYYYWYVKLDAIKIKQVALSLSLSYPFDKLAHVLLHKYVL